MKFLIRLSGFFIPLLFVCGITVIQWWGWALLFAGISLLALCTSRWKILSILFPLTLGCIAYLTADWLSFTFWIITSLVFRWLIKEEQGGGISWGIVCLVLIPITLKFMPAYAMLSITATILSFPLPRYKCLNWRPPKWGMAIGYALLVLVISYNAIQINWFPKRGLYLEHGVWANAKEELTLDNLTNRGAYSYSNFRKAFDLDRDSTLDRLNLYDHVWIVTPTKPFSKEEITQLEHYVRSGGRLFLVADHTDLYGHARVLNSIANSFGSNFTYTATFSTENQPFFTDAFSKKSVIKTGNSVIGKQSFPILSTWLWQEPAHYGEANFFGPLAASGNNTYAPQVLSSISSIGNGFVFYIDDSTFFANFAVYQPYVLDSLARLNSYTIIAFVLKWLPWCWLLLLISLLFYQQRFWGGWAIIAIVLLPLGKEFKISHDKPVQIWSGNPSFIFEEGCPYANISTAYALSGLSSRTPCWVDNVPLSSKDVIWVDTIPPPNTLWRWIQPHDIHFKRSKTNLSFESLYEQLHAQHFVEDINLANYQHIKPSGVWTDAVMNDWWFDQGVSTHRRKRISSWIGWLDKNVSPLPQVSIDTTLFSHTKYPCVLYVKDKEPITLNLPIPLQQHGEIYLGQGISGTVLIEKNKLSIIGQKPQSENIEAPTAWVLDYSIHH